MANELMAQDSNRWEAAKKMAQMVSQVQGFGYFKKPSDAMLVAMKAHDMGLSFTEALEQVYVVKGRTAIQGALMLKRIYEAGHEIEIIENNASLASIKGKRKGSEKWVQWSFSIEDARRGQLLTKDSWRMYPQDMLLWRCVARAARFQFPDCLGGAAHLPEEIGGSEERDITGNDLQSKESDLSDVFTSSNDQPQTPEAESPQKSESLGDDSPAESTEHEAQPLPPSRL